MNHSTLFDSMEQWTPEQLLAVVDFCQMLSDSIWSHHDQRLIAYLNEKNAPPKISGPDEPDETNLSLPFDDYLDF